MSSASPFSPPTSENMGLQDSTDAARTPSLQQRPRFLRAITSPLPVLSTFAARDAGYGEGAHDTSHLADQEYEHPTAPHRCDPRSRPIPSPHKLPPDQQQRSFSSSVISSFLPSSVLSVLASPTGSTQPTSSIAETLLRERRRSSGQTLNWMPSFTRGHQSENAEAHPSPIILAEASTRSLKSVQRSKQDGIGLQSASHQDLDESNGCASVGLHTTPVSGSMCNGLALDANMNHFKTSKARTRRVSESGQGTPPYHLSNGLTERLSGFAQSMRTRPPLAEDNPTPPSSLNSSYSASAGTTPSKPSPIRQRSLSGDTSRRLAEMNIPGSDKGANYNSWDDFMEDYSHGRFLNVSSRPPPQPKLEPCFPPFPVYVEGMSETNPPPYLAAPLPPKEDERLKALYSFQILETGPDVNFERIAHLVATVMGVSGCLICLVDYDYVSIKANCRAENMDCRRDLSFSSHAILRPAGDPLVVLDASRDWRFKAHPNVTGGSKIRFYAGAPLATADGYNIGTLCVIDPNPRAEFTEKERALLVDFAAVVMREMELWNDQVQLCTRTRMMRDITRWVRERLDRVGNEQTSPEVPSLYPHLNAEAPVSSHSPAPSVAGGEGWHHPVSTPAIISGSLAGTPYQPSCNTSSLGQVLPTPTSSPTLPSTAIGTSATQEPQEAQRASNRLEDVAFPSACSMIQASMNVEAVYLVQTTTSKTSIPLSRSSRSWGKLGTSERSKGSVGTLGGGELLDPPKLTLKCLSTSQSQADSSKDTTLDEFARQGQRMGDSWICNDGECRPHRLDDEQLSAIEPDWERDRPIILEMLSYVRQETPVPTREQGQSPLITYSQASEEDDIDESSSNPTSHGIRSKRLLCHTFQGTLPDLASGPNSPFRSCVVMPIRGASPVSHTPAQDEEPWAYFIVLSASRTKQFSMQERIYLKNFGSCLVTEVLKQRVEAADKAKGTFIQSISHELRTPLHIIMGTLELLYANADDTLNDHQLTMIASAESAGKGLIDIINNIIDLADLDLDNVDSQGGKQGSLPELLTQVQEMDIRELCEEVAGSMARTCSDKNIVVVPTWSKPSLAPLSSAPVSATVPSPIACVAGSIPIPVQSRNRTALEDSINGNVSSAESQHAFSSTKHSTEHKPTLELLVAMDEPDKDPESHWNFMINLPVVKRILTQLLENALKFTNTGFVEISAVSPPLASFPLKPPEEGTRPILFTVRDTGKGISPEFIDGHLFERFTQENPMETGTGLGLALVKLLVESLGGWLEIWSEGVEGKGCVVRVLIWATPVPNKTGSLKDEDGPWQEKSCRFYTGESSVSSDRLWKIMGERIMSQELNMNIQRGDEQDISPEDMMKDLNDHSPCDLLVVNDDLTRLKAYLSHWADVHSTAKTQGSILHKEPVPLLMLTSMWKDRKARALVEAYRNTWIDNGQLGHAATVVLMPKPMGPLKLLSCLEACFSGNSDIGASQGTHEPTDDSGNHHLTSVRLLRSNSIPHIATMALGFRDTRLMSTGTMIKSTFRFPPTSKGIHDASGVMTPRSASGYGHRSRGSRIRADSLSQQQSEDENTDSADRASSDRLGVNGAKSKRQRSIRQFISQRRGSIKGPSRKVAATGEESAPGISTDAQGQPLPVEGEDQLGILTPIPRVLIVEDNTTNRVILKTFLKKRGVGVVEAENGKLGVEKFQEEVRRRQGRAGFEFVLMDLQMPVMDGNVATKRIREFEQNMVKQHGLFTPEESSSEDSIETSSSERAEAGSESSPKKTGYQPTTIFALTGLAGEEDRRLAFECGVDGYLTKPVGLTALGALLSSCHPSHRTAATAATSTSTSTR